jgi:glyceraldehyde-3-phosphate dehydrogenase/erythrose-4-phosphate dehydrogenase
MATRIGINGFGRMGRLALRAGWDRPDLEDAFRRAAQAGPLAGILGSEERPLVSVDFKDDPRSAIVDAPSTMVVDDTCVKVLAAVSWVAAQGDD